MRGALLVIAAGTLFGCAGPRADRSADREVWRSFREALRSGRMADSARYRPLAPDLLLPLMGFLETLRQSTRWDGDGPEPEIHHEGDRVHYLVPLTLQRGDSTWTKMFCFTLVLDRGGWYFQHLEGITIRLDRIGRLPATRFPDFDDGQKAWIRDEIQLTKHVRLFSYLSRTKGRDAALDWFRDGRGYALQARTWVPFVSPERAFILYLCWDLSNLRGEQLVLEALSDTAATVRFAPRAFALYAQAGHLRQQISAADFRRLFEVVWLDRARSAGWDPHISYERGLTVFRFLRHDAGPRTEAGLRTAPR